MTALFLIAACACWVCARGYFYIKMVKFWFERQWWRLLAGMDAWLSASVMTWRAAPQVYADKVLRWRLKSCIARPDPAACPNAKIVTTTRPTPVQIKAFKLLGLNPACTQ